MRLFTNWSLTPAQFLIPLMIIAALMNGYLFIRNPNMGGDALRYHEAFHNFVTGKGWTYFNGTYIFAPVEPGYGMLSYLFYLFVRDIEYSGMLLSTFAYLLMIPTVYYTVNFLFGKRSALLAACLITFWPTLISYSYINLADCAYVFFLFLGFSQFVRVLLDKNSVSANALLGLLLGFAYLVREAEGLLVSMLALFCLFVLAFVKLRQAPKKPLFSFSNVKLFLAPITASLVFFAVALPYILIIQTYTGVWTPTSKILPVIDPPQEQQAIAEVNETSEPTASQENNAPASTEEVQIPKLEIAHSPRMTNLVQNVDELFVKLFRINIHAFVTLALVWAVYPLISTKRQQFPE